MLGADPIPSKQIDILPYLTDDAANTSLHWVLLHELTHVLEPSSMPKLGESWADLAPAAYYKMVRDTEIWETNKNTTTVATLQFFVDDYLAAGADYQNATASGFGNYAGSAGYSLLWFIGDEFGFGVYREGSSTSPTAQGCTTGTIGACNFAPPQAQTSPPFLTFTTFHWR